MNKTQIIALLEQGAQLNVKTGQFIHPSFKKGFRKMRPSDVSWSAASRELMGRLVLVAGVYSLTK